MPLDGADNIHGRSRAFTESDVDFTEFQDFIAGLRTLRKSAARISDRDDCGDDVNRTSLAISGVTVTHLALSGGSDSSTSVLSEDVNRISPAYSEVAVNHLALSGAQAASSRGNDSSTSAILEVSAVESRGDDTPTFRNSTPSSPERSAHGSGATLDSDYWRLEHAASVLKAARGSEIQGGAVPPTSSTDVPQNVKQTDTSLTLTSNPLHAYRVVRDTGSARGRGGFAGGRGRSAGGRVRFTSVGQRGRCSE